MSAEELVDVASVLEKLNACVQILVLISGQLKDGSDHYAYASIPVSRYPDFKKAEAKGNYNLGDFGEILLHGEGSTPPDDVKKQIEETYAASHTLEADIEALRKELFPSS